MTHRILEQRPSFMRALSRPPCPEGSERDDNISRDWADNISSAFNDIQAQATSVIDIQWLTNAWRQLFGPKMSASCYKQGLKRWRDYKCARAIEGSQRHQK